MSSTPSPRDPSTYFESLMQAGQQSMKEFDDALVVALGVRGKSSSPINQPFSPFSFAVDMQREYLTQFWRFWNTAIIKTFSLGTNTTVQPSLGDKRFKDDAW